MSMPLFQDWLSLFVALGGLAKGIYDWAEITLRKSKDQKEKQAVYMLRNAAVLVLALRTLHNSVKTILGRVSLVYPDTPMEQRMELMREINDFARRDFVLGFIRQTEKELRELLANEENLEDKHRALLERLLQLAGRTLRAAHDPYGSPFQSIDELEAFLQRLREAQTEEDIKALKKDASETIKAFESRILVDADEAYGALKADLSRKYPSLPDAGWAVELDALKGYA
jgi:hypothetical protein